MLDPTKATVISLFPLELNESKPGLYPGYYVIPAAPMGEISFLDVGEAVFYQETKNDIPTAVRTAAVVVAESIVRDFVSSHIGRIVEVAEPGLFWVPGGGYLSTGQIWHEHEPLIRKAEVKQLRWFEELVKIADDSYSRTHRHTSVSTLQRLAAQRLGASRPWMIRTGSSDNTCRFCKSEVPYGAVKCPTCREIIDMETYREMIGDQEAHRELKGESVQ